MKKYCLHILLIFFWLDFSRHVHAQTDYTFELITIDERANFGDVHTLYQDSTGIIWMGIYGKGLAYYNGKEIHRLKLPDEGNFSQHNDVFVASENYIFLNYGNSVKLFDPIQQEITQSIQLNNSFSTKGKISNIAVTKKNDDLLVWAILLLNEKNENQKDNYLLLLSKNKAPFQQINQTLLSTIGEPIIKSIGTNTLIKEKNGLIQINESGEITKHYPLTDVELANINTFNLSVSENQDLWYTSSCGYKINKEAKGKKYLCDISHWKKSENAPLIYPITWNTYYNIIIPKTNQQQYSSISKLGNKLFLGNNKLFNPTSQSVENINLTSTHERKGKSGIKSAGQLFTMLEDETGVVWVGGTYGLGKMVPQSNAFKLLPTISMRSFVEDEKGFIYGSVDWSVVASLDPIPKPTLHTIRVYDPAADTVGNLLTNTNWHQAVIHNGRIYYRRHSLDLSSNKIKKYDLDTDALVLEMVLLDRKERLWRTGWGSSEIIIGEPDMSESIKKIFIPQLKEKPVEINDWYQRPSDGSIWMGTYGQGIFIFTEDGDISMHLHTSSDSPVELNNNVVSGFYEDRKRSIWLGHGEGLSRLSPDLSQIEHFYIDPKQPELRLVYSIIPEDDDRYLWVSTSQGIFRFDAETGVFFDFPLHPIIMDTEYNRTSFYKAKNGRIYFGTSSSSLPTISFFPEEAMDYYQNIESSQANIVLDHFSEFDGKKEHIITSTTGLQALKKIVLNPGDRYFSLEFMATDYRSPKDNYYSYYLEGYEKDWNEPSRNNNQIKYENLSPGKYTLKMRGALMRENLDLNERQIKVIVLPYWYQTWWSKVLFGLIACAGFYLFYRIKITRQYETQEALRLKDLDDLKSRLYTNITHEFRTPLTVIMGMNDNIKGHELEKSLIKRNANNLLRLINQLLDLSKLDSGTLKIDAVQGDIIGYLQYLTESFYSMASDKKVILTFKSETNKLVMDFDEVKTQHVIYNLLSNAIKFTNPGGKVALETSDTILNEKPHLKIKIKDTGTGIPEKDLPHIFDRFYQVEKKEEKKIKTFAGTGIGLALTKELIELMGGNISVKSEVDWGTEFTILLPVRQKLFTPKLDMNFEVKYPEKELVPDYESLPVQPDQIAGEKPQVLIIEDNAGVVTYIKTLLEEDYNTLVSINGQEGINMALEHIPDIIITDVMMPEKNGYEVCDTLKRDERTSHIPIIMLTAKADMSSRIEGLEKGADAYLSKPFEKDELLVRLRKLLELRKELQKRYSSLQTVIEKSFQDNDSALREEEFIEDKFIAKLRFAIDERLDDADMSIPELCKSVHLSHTQLYRKLKALTGKTPSQFVRSIRLLKAKEMLEKNSSLNISEIAYEVGFSDPNYFTRMFKEEFGKVPGDVRNTSA